MVSEDKGEKRLWSGGCIRCNWAKEAEARERIVEQADDHHERKIDGDAHKVVIRDPDGDINGYAIWLLSSMFHKLDHPKGVCERNDCENGGTIELILSSPMEQTDWNESTPETPGSDGTWTMCEECAAEYDNNQSYDEEPTSIKRFLESEKE